MIDYTKENVLSEKPPTILLLIYPAKWVTKAARQIMKSKALFLNPTPKPIEIPVSLFKNLFRAKKHVVILSGPSTKYTDVLLAALKKGLEIEVNNVFPFSQYKEAYRYAEQGGYIGKVAVELN